MTHGDSWCKPWSSLSNLRVNHCHSVNKQDVGREEQPLEHDPSEMSRREQKEPETIQLDLVSHTQSHREGDREGEREGEMRIFVCTK